MIKKIAWKLFKGFVRKYWMSRYNLPKYVNASWFAFFRKVEQRKYPEYFRDHKYVHHQVGDVIPFQELEDGKLAYYRIKDKYKPRGDYALWDDGTLYNLEFDSVR